MCDETQAKGRTRPLMALGNREGLLPRPKLVGRIASYSVDRLSRRLILPENCTIATRAIGILLWVSAAAAAAPPVLRFTTPMNGAILLGADVIVKGEVVPAPAVGTRGRLQVNDEPSIEFVVGNGGRWSAQAVLREGPNQLLATVRAPGQPWEVILVANAPASFRPLARRLSVFLLWHAEGVAAARQALSETIQPAPPPAQVDVAVGQLRARVMNLLRETFRDFGIAFSELQLGASSGTGHVIHFEGSEPGDSDQVVFGRTPVVDCGHPDLDGSSKIFVGTLVRALSARVGFEPIKEDDTLAIRTEDVARAVVHSAAHELLHGVGLVGCGWLPQDEQDEFHHRPNAPMAGAADRSPFGLGKHLADSGLYVYGSTRIGETGQERAVLRLTATLSDIDRAYLRLVHPGGSPTGPGR